MLSCWAEAYSTRIFRRTSDTTGLLSSIKIRFFSSGRRLEPVSGLGSGAFVLPATRVLMGFKQGMIKYTQGGMSPFRCDELGETMAMTDHDGDAGPDCFQRPAPKGSAQRSGQQQQRTVTIAESPSGTRHSQTGGERLHGWPLATAVGFCKAQSLLQTLR